MITDLAESPALSILGNSPDSFEGRKVGALVADGTDAELVEELRFALAAEGALLELVAPTVGGFTAADGSVVAADQKYGGGPSVVYDAVVVLTGPPSTGSLRDDAFPAAFVADAFAHCKFIGYVDDALSVFDSAGIGDRLDDGFVALDDDDGVSTFVQACRQLRYWQRESLVPVP